MATSIFFTESKDFKLIKDRILNQEDNYLVYVYADTSNIRIPRELISELPKYGNNLIWVDTVDMDATELSNHIILTIGQLLNAEEETGFYIVAKSSKLEKTVIFLRNQGIPAEWVGPDQDKAKQAKPKVTGHRGRPKKVEAEDKAAVKTGKRGRPVKEVPASAEGAVKAKPGKRGRPKKEKTEEPTNPGTEAQSRKRGRPKAEKIAVAEAVPAEPKKRGRKKVEKPESGVKAKRGRKPSAKKEKTEKPRKPREDKEITEEMVQEKLYLYPTTDTNMHTVMGKLFGLKKVARPKFEAKLLDMVKLVTLEDDIVAENIITQLKEKQIIESKGTAGRIIYKD